MEHSCVSNWISTFSVMVSAITAIWALIKTSKIAKQSDKTAKASLEIAKQSQNTAKQQMQISMFAEFTRRYQEIMLHIRQDGDDKTYYQTLYIDLCSEEFFMHNEGFLPEKVWDVWLEGMKHEVKNNYIGLWQRDKHNYNPEFQRFFDEIVSNNDKNLK